MSYDEISRQLGQMDGKLDMLLDSRTDHEGRLRGLEKRERWLAGATATVAALWAFLIGK